MATTAAQQAQGARVRGALDATLSIVPKEALQLKQYRLDHLKDLVATTIRLNAVNAPTALAEALRQVQDYAGRLRTDALSRAHAQEMERKASTQ